MLPPSPASAVPADPRIAGEALRTIPPREQAGNVDIKQLGKGARLFIPVDTPGALFSAGDAHFAQGDCETCGTAIEMRATLRVRFGLRKGEAAEKGIRYPRFARDDYYLPPEFAAPRRFYATTGISVTEDGENHAEDATLAARNALLNMIDHLDRTRLDPAAGLRDLQRRRRPQDQPARRRPQHAGVGVPPGRYLRLGRAPARCRPAGRAPDHPQQAVAADGHAERVSPTRTLWVPEASPRHGCGCQKRRTRHATC